MFKRGKDKEIDITSLNHILKTGKRIINIGYFMAIIALILLSTYLIKEWKILSIIKEFFIVISPIFIGFLIAWLFEPLVTKLQKKKVPRILGCIFVYILILGFLFLLSYLFIPSLISQVKDFVAAAPDIFEDLTDFILGIVSKFDTNNYVDIVGLKREITSYATEYVVNFASDVPNYLLSFIKVLFNGGLNFVLGLMIGFYLLFDFNKAGDFLYNLVPVDLKEAYKELVDRINNSLRSYVQGVLVIMLLVFVTQSVGLTIAGMKAPILFALFCAVTDVIPYFGPYIGGIPAVVVGFTISPITGICVLISILVVQLLENNFYQPLIMGHTMKLHPVTIMLGLLLFQHFFGIIGMVVATPVIACLKVLFMFLNERLKLIDRVLGDNSEAASE